MILKYRRKALFPCIVIIFVLMISVPILIVNAETETRTDLIEEVDYSNESSKEIRFSTDIDEYLEVNKNEPFGVKITTNYPINEFRLIVPKGTEFSFEDEKNRVLVEKYNDESCLWNLEFNNEKESFYANFSVKQSGQISIEDIRSEIHSSFFYVNTDGTERNVITMSEESARTAVTVRTWAAFRTAWNTPARTRIDIDEPSLLTGTTSLNTRTTNVSVNGLLTSGLSNVPTLTWSPNVTVDLNRVRILNTDINGGILNTSETTLMYHSNASINLRTLNATFRTDIAAALAPISFNVGTLNIMPTNNGEVIVRTANTINSQSVNLRNSDNFNIQNVSGTKILESNSMNIATGIMIWNLGDNLSTRPVRGWDKLEAVILNNDVTQSSNPSFNNDTFQLDNISRIRGWGFRGDVVQPPTSLYTLTVQAIPEDGGSPEIVGSSELSEGDSTEIKANPNKDYDFIRWEIVSGNKSSISNVNDEITKLTMGDSDTNIHAIYKKKTGGIITVNHVDEQRNKIADSYDLTGLVGEKYETSPKKITGYSLKETPSNASGLFTLEDQIVIYTYSKDRVEEVPPVDPINPEIEVDPENKPELPENQGLLSIDFVSQFNFGKQVISSKDQTYYAKPQILINENSVVDTKERPNYIQISDRRPVDERNGGWELSVTQNGQFKGNKNKSELSGAAIKFTNQQLATAQGGNAPTIQENGQIELIPNNKRVLLKAKTNTGTGTWIYRFGDLNTADKSISLEIPSKTNPEAINYSTKLSWELSSVPNN